MLIDHKSAPIIRTMGIDPGADTTGIAIVDSDGHLQWHKTTTYEDAAVKLPSLINMQYVGLVLVETTRPGVLYGRYQGKPKHVQLKIMGNAGTNQFISRRLFRIAKSTGATTRYAAPGKRGTKWSPEYWRAVFAWGESRRLPSQHVRDAASLAYTGGVKYMAERFDEFIGQFHKRYPDGAGPSISAFCGNAKQDTHCVCWYHQLLQWKRRS